MTLLDIYPSFPDRPSRPPTSKQPEPELFETFREREQASFVIHREQS